MALSPTSPPQSLGLLSISEDLLQVPSEWRVTCVDVNTSDVLGRGSYGTVCRAKWHGSSVAVKKLHEIFFEMSVTPDSKRGILKAFAKELNILFQLKHPNIVQFYGVYEASGAQTLELSSDTYLVQELMHCALDVRNRKSPRFSLRNVVDITLDICSGLCYLHERPEPIIHRDLATKNILLNQSGTAKIADLGVAKILESSHSTPQTRQPGTELYMPPEVKIAGMVYDTKLDVFSLGVIILEICVGHDVSASEAFQSQPGGGILLVAETQRRKTDFDDLGDHILRSLIVKCLSKKETRPNVRSIQTALCSVQHSSRYINTPHQPVILTVDNADVKTVPSQEASDVCSAVECKRLREKVANLSADNDHLQHKLDATLRQEREEREEDETRTEQSQEVKLLKAKNEALLKTVGQKEAEISHLSSLGSPPSSLTSADLRDQRASLLAKFNELQTAKDKNESELETLRVHNADLKRQLEQPLDKRRMQEHPSASRETEYLQGEIATLSKDKVMLEAQVRDLAMQQLRVRGYHTGTGGGPSSLPESLGSGNVEAAMELQKMKKMVEKYKESTIQMDLQLKDARLDLQRRADASRTVASQAENDRLRAEVYRLQAHLDQAERENSSLLSRIHRQYS